MRQSTIAIALFAAGVAATAAFAEVIHVPGDYPDIQTAVLASSSGDEIVLAPGTYTGEGNRGVRFHGRRLTVRSATRNPADVLIRCEGLDRALDLNDDDASGSTIEGIHFVDGRAISGGAIYASGADITILNCHFTNNTATASGGGAIRLYQCNGTVRGCRFRANRAEFAGAIMCGAGHGKRSVIDSCEFLGNECDGAGGAIGAANTIPVITNCVFSGNQSEWWGGAVYLDYGAHAIIANCVVSQNRTDGPGGGLWIGGNATPVITNTILWGNVDQDGTGETAQIHYESDAAPTLVHSCVQGTWSGEGFGNTDTDPRLVDADGPDDNPGNLDDNCRLRSDSPCIDAGLSVAIALDLDGNQRIVDDPATDDSGVGFLDVIDKGPYEYGSAPPCPADVDTDGDVGFSDLLRILTDWGGCP